MKNLKIPVAGVLLLALAGGVQGQQAEVEALRSGVNFIESEWYTEAEDLELLAKDKAGRRQLYEKLGMPLDKTVE